MGMFDEVNFSYRMPDGFVPLGFQTKDLDCLMDIYTISKTGRLIRDTVFEQVQRPLGDMNFSGMLNVYTTAFLTEQWHEYDLEFVEGTLVAIHCKSQSGRLIFDPNEYIGDEAEKCANEDQQC
uniref:hypothetical protein n=1 Tax=Pseudomonas syringae TaxID=317 RepID=UPI001E554100|nr:hypothetical protein [Pseudomonas syringae]QOQ33415.1 hypothetical protein [Pseudomonas syringae pv. actinidiae]